MFYHRSRRRGEVSKEYRNYEDAAQRIAPYLDKEEGWKLIVDADNKARDNYLGWCVKMVKRGPWRREGESRELPPQVAHEICTARKELHALDRILYENPEDRFACEHKKEVEKILAKYSQSIPQGDPWSTPGQITDDMHMMLILFLLYHMLGCSTRGILNPLESWSAIESWSAVELSGKILGLQQKRIPVGKHFACCGCMTIVLMEHGC